MAWPPSCFREGLSHSVVNIETRLGWNRKYTMGACPQQCLHGKELLGLLNVVDTVWLRGGFLMVVWNLGMNAHECWAFFPHSTATQADQTPWSCIRCYFYTVLLRFRVRVMLRFVSRAPVFLAVPPPPPLLSFALNLPRRLAAAANVLSGMVNTDFLLLQSCLRNP
jgi:hypothetical protein